MQSNYIRSKMIIFLRQFSFSAEFRYSSSKSNFRPQGRRRISKKGAWDKISIERSRFL